MPSVTCAPTTTLYVLTATLVREPTLQQAWYTLPEPEPAEAPHEGREILPHDIICRLANFHLRMGRDKFTR